MSKSREAELSLSIKDLWKKFEFDVKTGEIWSNKTGDYADKLHHFRGQSFSATRYKQVQVWLKRERRIVKIAAHRMIWAVANGRWPADGMVIDHINSDTLDNRICNLMEVSVADNARRINQRIASPQKSAPPLPSEE
ncbi:MAG: HNH endonuclease signature motif containing protein [Alphaproteobacteria bacterium]